MLHFIRRRNRRVRRFVAVVGITVVVVGVFLTIRLRTAAQIHSEALEQFRLMLETERGDVALARDATDRLTDIRRQYYDQTSAMFDEFDGVGRPRIRLDLRVLRMPDEAVFQNFRRQLAVDDTLRFGEADFAAHVDAAWGAVGVLDEIGAFDLIDSLAETETVLFLPPENAGEFFSEENDTLRFLALLRQLSAAIAGMQFRAGRDGQWSELLTANERGRCIERLASNSWPCMISSLVAMSCRQSRHEVLFQLIAEQRLGLDVGRELLASVDESARVNALYGLAGERLLITAVLADPSPVMGGAEPILFAIISSPVDDLKLTDELFGRAKRLIEAKQWTNAEKQELYGIDASLGSITSMMLSIVAPAIDRFVINARVSIGEQHACETAIAIDLFRQVTGAYPASLADLTPEFIRTAPMDPFSDSPLKYAVTDDGESFVLYSIGLDGVDDHGVHGIDAVRLSGPALDYRYFPPPANDTGAE